MEVFRGIELFPGPHRDSNVYLIDNEIIVDTGTGLFFSQIRQQLIQHFDTSSIRLIVNTHAHFDHTGGNKKFRDWLGCGIAIHRDDKEALETGNTLAELFGETGKITTVDEALQHGQALKTKKFSFEVLHTPGHTPGSICLYEKQQRILISGDTLFESGVGRTDLQGGSAAQLHRSLETLAAYPAVYLLPGHGNPRTGGISFLVKQMAALVKEGAFV